MSSANLHAASSEWASRPADERFWTMRDLRLACEASRAGSGTKRVPIGSLKATAVDDAIALTGPAGKPAALTHYAFGQLAATVGAPASYLRELPAPVAAECLNVGLANVAREGRSDRDLLFHQNGRLTVRAVLSDKYERVWDSDVCAYFERLTDAGWRAPAGRYMGQGQSRPATEADILPGQINIQPGDRDRAGRAVCQRSRYVRVPGRARPRDRRRHGGRAHAGDLRAQQ